MQTESHAKIKEKIFIRALGMSILFLISSFVIHYFSSVYVNEQASNAVTDIILSNIPVFNVEIFFVYGPVLFWIFIGIVSIRYIRRIPFVINNIAFFTIVRSIFVTLTHLGPIPTQALITGDNIISRFSSSYDYFFSGHTGFPFLMALIFWDIKPIRYVCLVASVFFGAIVLLGHYHYSIDVFSAFFITFSIYKIAEFLFKKEKELFKGSYHD